MNPMLDRQITGWSVGRRRVRTLTVALGAGLCLGPGGPPAQAQTADQFQSAPVTPAAPKPRPQPRRPVAPEPEMVAPSVAPAPVPPPPAANLPSASEFWARVRQVALAQGVDVPLASNPPFDATGTPPQFRALLGAWGPGIWQGAAGADRMMLIVLGVGGDGSVRGVIGRSSGLGWSNYSEPIAGNRFVVHVLTTYEASGFVPSTRTAADDYWQFELRSDGRLYGSRRTDGAVTVLPRLQ